MTNFVTNAGSGGSTFASDTISTVEYPLAKSAWGAAGAVNQTAMAAALPVQPGTGATWFIQGVQPAATTGTVTTSTSTISTAVSQLNLATITISGTYAGVNITFEQSADGGTTWYPCAGSRVDTGVIESVSGVLTANTTRAWDVPIGGATNFRVRATAWTSGTANIVIAPQSFAYDPCPGAVAQGPAASGTAVLGNPLLCGGSDATSVRSFLVSTSGVMAAQLTGATGTAMLPAAAASADAFANPTVTQVGAANLVFNGTSWDRQRGMGLATTTGDTGAKTATGNGATQTNVGNKGVSVVIVLGTVSGTTPTCTFKLQSSTDGGTNWVDIPGAATASLTATGVFGIDVYPGAAVTAGTTTTGTKAVASQVLPRTWRVVWTIGGTTPSFTITSITFNYIPN